MEDPSLDTVMARRFALCDEIAVLTRQHKAELQPVTDELELCERFIKAQLLTDKVQQWKSAITGHSTHFVTKTSCTVSDMNQVIDLVLAAAPIPDALPIDPALWGEVLAHIHKTGLWAMLTNAVSKETAKEYVKEHKAPPPGVKYTEFKDLAWTKGK